MNEGLNYGFNGLINMTTFKYHIEGTTQIESLLNAQKANSGPPLHTSISVLKEITLRYPRNLDYKKKLNQLKEKTTIPTANY